MANRGYDVVVDVDQEVCETNNYEEARILQSVYRLRNLN